MSYAVIEGWVKMYREIMDHPVWVNPIDYKIFSWLIFKAAMSDRTTSVNTGRGSVPVSLKKGQMIFGRFKAEEELGINGSTIYKVIQRLEKFECIICESNTHYTLITITNYDSYQSNNTSQVTSKEHPSNKQVTSKEHPSNTYKESKEQLELKELTIHPLQDFIKNLPEVSKLKYQLTYKNCEDLLSLFSKDVVKDVLEAMDNTKDLTKKYNTVFKTCKNWCERRNGNNPTSSGPPLPKLV